MPFPVLGSQLCPGPSASLAIGSTRPGHADPLPSDPSFPSCLRIFLFCLDRILPPRPPSHHPSFRPLLRPRSGLPGSPWATWPCSPGSASTSLAWTRGLCCCSTTSSKDGAVGGPAGAGDESPDMGRSGSARSGKCGLALGGGQGGDSSPCRGGRERTIQTSEGPRLHHTPPSTAYHLYFVCLCPYHVPQDLCTSCPSSS